MFDDTKEGQKVGYWYWKQLMAFWWWIDGELMVNWWYKKSYPKIQRPHGFYVPKQISVLLSPTKAMDFLHQLEFSYVMHHESRTEIWPKCHLFPILFWSPWITIWCPQSKLLCSAAVRHTPPRRFTSIDRCPNVITIVWLRWCKMYHHWLILYIYILLDPYLHPVYHTNWHRPCLQLGLEDEFPVNIGYSMGKLLLWGKGYVTSFRQSGDRLVDNPIEVYLQSPYTRVIFTITIPITIYESLYINLYQLNLSLRPHWNNGI